jgi:peroxiredoxin
MKRTLLASTMAAAILGAAALGVSAIAAPTVATSVPERADNFQLTDHTRLAHELHYFKDAKAIVLMSQVNGTSVSRKAAAELEKLQAKYKAQGVLFYMLNSKDSRDAAAAEAKAQGFDIPVLVDELQLVGGSLGVQREGEVFVVDPKSQFKIAYHGPVSETAKALDAVVAGQPVAKSRIEVKSGAEIKFADRGKAAEHAAISYSDEIAPILQAKCVACHQKGGIAPFAMDSFEIVKAMAPMIRESVRAERMPPYFADPHIGSFQNDQALTADQTKKLIHWLEAGAPRGTGRDALKEDASEAPEWPVYLGKPDVIVELPAFDVASKGLIEYQNMRVDNPFKEDAWLRAISIKPGDRSVLHHVVSNHVADPKLPKSKIPGGSVGSYTPGAEAQVIAKDAGAPVPGGGKLNFQMHYTTTGKAATDRTQVGFYTLKAPPKFIKRSTVIGDFGLKIPAGSARHQEVSYQTFPADAYIYTLYPHSHYRGFSVELKAVTPDGKEEMLLSLPKYDFNWQRDYDPKEPILVKKGTKLVAKWIYDNSEHNKANPDPTINVTWGEQSWEEMMYFRVNYRWADETVSNVRNDLQAKLMDSRTIGALDNNADNKVQIDELTGTMASVRTRFADLDTNKDGGLDKKELEAGNVSRASATRDLRDADIDL